MQLTNILQNKIKQTGPMPFVDFMHHALYEPGLGYYSAGLQKFGAQGDFITAPELSPLFGHTLAQQCLEVFQRVSNPCLFEFGAGSGRLCVDLLTALETHHCLPEIYYILEVSGDLQARQRELIAAAIPHLYERVQWLSAWPTTPFNGVVIANEVLDAMPVHRFMQTQSGVLESYITLDAKEAFQETFMPCENAQLLAHVQSVLSNELVPYQSEANLLIDGWLQQCYAMLSCGAVFLIDYGFPAHEYYHPDRCMGTIMCHYRHQAHANPLLHIGEQDITAHVDFSHVAHAAVAAGFQVAGYTNQAAFLLANGLLSLLATIEPESQRIKQQQAVKQLLQPNEMGELFKVIALTKHLEGPWTGFQLQDKRVSL